MLQVSLSAIDFYNKVVQIFFVLPIACFFILISVYQCKQVMRTREGFFSLCHMQFFIKMYNYLFIKRTILQFDPTFSLFISDFYEIIFQTDRVIQIFKLQINGRFTLARLCNLNSLLKVILYKVLTLFFSEFIFDFHQFHELFFDFHQFSQYFVQYDFTLRLEM